MDSARRIPVGPFIEQDWVDPVAPLHDMSPPDDDIVLDSIAVRGRCGTFGAFLGKIDMTTGKLRVDHSHDHAFWLEVDLEPLVEAYMAFKYSPGGPVAQAAQSRWNAE